MFVYPLLFGIESIRYLKGFFEHLYLPCTPLLIILCIEIFLLRFTPCEEGVKSR
jgi:hypothetical protein